MSFKNIGSNVGNLSFQMLSYLKGVDKSLYDTMENFTDLINHQVLDMSEWAEYSNEELRLATLIVGGWIGLTITYKNVENLFE